MKFKEDIGEFVFLADKPHNADIIFVPGGSFAEPSELASQLYKRGYAKKIMPSGRYSVLKGEFLGVTGKSHIYNKTYTNEWDFMRDVLIENGVSSEDVLKENRAENTYQNAMYSKEETDRLGLNIRTAIICCKAQHARRCEMYYQLYYPETKLLICPIVVEDIAKENWHSTEKGVKAVMGEILRIGQQFGDLI